MSSNITALQTKLNLRGAFVDREWIEAAISFLEKENQKVDETSVFEQFIYSDFRHCGIGCLQETITSCHNYTIPGPYILQVNEIFNIGESYEKRNQESSSRMLKLALTDGKQSFFGFEYQKLSSAIHVNSKPGLKVL